ncbi:juvenile hormone acid O-methyltransferase-like isoform X2 [Rhipicephalus sanguineus]|uniref:juvenile hormone acid O-methyltransferase-like isoform X2 n=1 Tax=Rhipicephalus sanguineus TaxID=34632 RepID=UPI0018961778|nr:juvenile hormone acid O-methyltransferase-like isoform X2 [Rhipicephalus sanguineus]
MAPQLSDSSPSAFLQKELPKIYDEVRMHNRESSGQLLKRFQASFFTGRKEDGESKEQYLDIGCGPGNFTCNYLLPLCPASMRRLVAVDNSYPMIDYARREHGHPRIEHRMLDIAIDDEVSQFIETEGQFDRVYSFLTFHWIHDKSAALRNVERLLTAGGECLIVFNPHPGPLQLSKAMINSERWKEYSDVLKKVGPEFPDTHDPVYLRNYLMDIVRSTSLVPLSCEVVRVEATSSSLFLHTNPVYSLLGKEGKAELENFLKELLKQGHCSNYSCTGTTRELRFVFHGL